MTPRRRLGVVLLADGGPPARRRSTARARTVTGTFDRTGNFLRDPFTVALPTTGDRGQPLGFVNTLTIPAGETRSLAHFVVTGLSETRAPTGGGRSRRRLAGRRGAAPRPRRSPPRRR